MRERLPVLIMKTKSGFELYTNQPTNQRKGRTSRYLLIYTEKKNQLNTLPGQSTARVPFPIKFPVLLLSRGKLLLLLLDLNSAPACLADCRTFARSFVPPSRRSSLSSASLHIIIHATYNGRVITVSQLPHSDHFLPSIGI